MSTAESTLNLQIELQNELVNSNQLLNLIKIEVQKIKTFTSVGSEFESMIKENALLMETLANMQQIDISNLPPLARTLI